MSKDQDKKINYKGKKRGMKPRSKRNRKRPRGGIGIMGEMDGNNSSKPTKLQIDILPLSFPGDRVQTKKRVRIVRPYPFTFATFAKARWLGRSLLDVYADEFGAYPRVYYQTAIEEGRILVNGNKVDCEYKIKGNDELAHIVHRHEPVVSISQVREGQKIDSKPFITVVHEDENIIAVDKPSAIPIHPCGSYNFNSLFHVLEDQDEALKDSLYNVHRLDRLTSGLTVIAKNTETAKVLGKSIMDREKCQKVYLARVKGKFPMNVSKNENLERVVESIVPVYGEWQCPDDANKNETPATCYYISSSVGEVERNMSLSDVFENKVDISVLMQNGTIENSNWINLSVPCEIVDPKNGICEAGRGKPAQTSFAVVRYDEETDSTVVLAKPMTGRTHQIRLHLQYLNHPICNDPNYGGDLNFADRDSIDLCNRANEKMKQIDNETNNSERPENSTVSDTPATEDELTKAGIGSHSRGDDEPLLDFIQRTCVWCSRNRGGDRNLLEFLIRSQGIWLHAYQYTLQGPDGMVSYKTSVPEWAK